MNRRQVLATGLALGIAGCLGGSDDEDDPLEDSAIESTDWEENQLTVTLESDSEADEITIEDSDGNEIAVLSIDNGTAETTFEEILDDTYTFTLTDGGEEVESVEIELSPELTVQEAERKGGATVDLDEEPDWPRDDFWEPRFQLEVELENTGSAPIPIQPETAYLAGNVPQTSDSSVYDHDRLTDPAKSPLYLEPGTTVTLDTEDSTTSLSGPFVIEGEEDDAEGWAGETFECELVIYDERGETHERTVEVSYENLVMAIPREYLGSYGRWSWETITVDLD